MASENIWVVAANSSTAKIFVASNNDTLRKIQQLEHPESRLLTSELVTDRQGRGNESILPMRHAKEPKVSPKKLEFLIFARDLSKYLQEASQQGRFKKLYIAASPYFLGLLRQELPQAIDQLIAGTIDSDLTEVTTGEIRSHLPYVL